MPSQKVLLRFDKKETQESLLQQVDFFASTPACLSDWFIHSLTKPGDHICDVFSGRGTTAISAFQQGRNVMANDINPLSSILIKGRITSTTEQEFNEVLGQAIQTKADPMTEEEARVFGIYFSPQTLQQLWSIRTYLLSNTKDARKEEAQSCLRFLVTERLLGNGAHYLSVSVPGIGRMNQPEQQAQHNRLRYPTGKPEKDVETILMNRFRHYQSAFMGSESKVTCFSQEASNLSGIPDQSIHLHFTVPPELNTQSYAEEHWLRLWYHGIKREEWGPTMPSLSTPDEWQHTMTAVLREQNRTLHKDGRSVWVFADTQRISETLWPRLLQSAKEIGWLDETEYACLIPMQKQKGRLQGNISVRIIQFLKK